MHDSSLLRQGFALRPAMLAILAGASAALPLYLWQQRIELAVATFLIVSYPTWIGAIAAGEISTNRMQRLELLRYPMNAFHRRFGRMLSDIGFWWSLSFGVAMICGAVWYVGMQHQLVLVAIAAAWSLLAVLLNFGLTLLHPTTRCRSCDYQLADHLDRTSVDELVRCPECGHRWSRLALGLAALPVLKPLPARKKRRSKSSDHVVEITPTAPSCHQWAESAQR